MRVMQNGAVSNSPNSDRKPCWYRVQGSPQDLQLWLHELFRAAGCPKMSCWLICQTIFQVNLPMFLAESGKSSICMAIDISNLVNPY